MLGGTYDPISPLSIDDQLFICESLKPELERSNYDTNGNANLKWNGNGTYKRGVGDKLAQSKLIAINELKKCTYKTPPYQVAEHLKEIFADEKSNDEHWLFIAQQWSPRAINRVIAQIDKQVSSGFKKVQNRPALFTYLIKRRKRRKQPW